jgi:hypothetical protein
MEVAIFRFEKGSFEWALYSPFENGSSEVSFLSASKVCGVVGRVEIAEGWILKRGRKF